MEQLRSSPSGHLVPTIESQRAFVPAQLPRHIQPTATLMRALEEALGAVANLAGVGETIQNPHLLIRPFVRREAVLSSRIEGTQASISDLFRFEASGARRPRGDVEEVANYVQALDYGMELLEELPISVRLINRVHSVLMKDVRGGETRPGELRDEQVWIGPPGTPIQEARYIPPPQTESATCSMIGSSLSTSPTHCRPSSRCAMMHYQFEAIHPYRDGTGALGGC